MTDPRWDLVVRGGTLIDPAQSIAAKRDVAFSGGKVAAVAEALAGEGTEEIDATGALVTPGLIDIHAHVYHGLYIGRHADQTSLANGVTTVVDAGSAGWMTLPGLRDYVIPTYRTRVYAFLHIGATGLVINRIMPELADINFAQVEEAARTAAENRPLVVGIKVRIAHRATGQGDQANAREALRRARQAADLARVRLMVHVSDTPIPLPEILDQLHAGDIATRPEFERRGFMRPIRINGGRAIRHQGALDASLGADHEDAQRLGLVERRHVERDQRGGEVDAGRGLPVEHAGQVALAEPNQGQGGVTAGQEQLGALHA